MPSRQWLHAWSSIRLSDKEGVFALKALVKEKSYGVDRQKELIYGTMTGDGQATLMTQADFYGRTESVEFLLENGFRENLAAQSASSLNASEYAKVSAVKVCEHTPPFSKCIHVIHVMPHVHGRSLGTMRPCKIARCNLLFFSFALRSPCR